MTESLKCVLRTVQPMDEAQLDAIAACFKPRAVKRGTLLLNAGETCREFYYVHRGCLRTFFLDRRGQEKTRLIMLDGWIGTALTSFISRQPSLECLDAPEDTELLALAHADFYWLLEEVPEWGSFYRKILEMAYMYQNRRIENRVTLSARQRYEKLLSEHPAYFRRLSNKLLASYLDVTQETLSRLKSG